MEDKGWDCIYVLVDLHDTILAGQYEGEEKYKFFPSALPALRLMTNRKDVKLILWTSTYPLKLNKYIRILKENGVEFDYINENPEALKFDSELCDTESKIYFNVGIDDKFGFEPEEDWYKIYKIFQAMQ